MITKFKEFNESKTDLTNTENFKNWFKDSKVVDDNGEPLIVYHQTQSKFSKFDIKRSLTHTFWFTSSLEKINNRETGAGTRPNLDIIVLEVYLSIQKMAGWNEYQKYGLGQLIGLGYDGIKLDDDYVVFYPEQIKSVKNNGEFDPTNKNIYK